MVVTQVDMLAEVKVQLFADSKRGKHCGLFYTLKNRTAVVKVQNLAHNLAIVDAKRWSIKCQVRWQ